MHGFQLAFYVKNHVGPERDQHGSGLFWPHLLGVYEITGHYERTSIPARFAMHIHTLVLVFMLLDKVDTLLNLLQVSDAHVVFYGHL